MPGKHKIMVGFVSEDAASLAANFSRTMVWSVTSFALPTTILSKGMLGQIIAIYLGVQQYKEFRTVSRRYMGLDLHDLGDFIFSEE
jgi:hypothetical protein